LHSRHDPLAEAQQWAAAVDVEGAFCFVVAGFGLGYHLAALHKRLQGDAFLICTEPDVRMLSTALSCVDLSSCCRLADLCCLSKMTKTRSTPDCRTSARS
jgi:hypothetical protein